LWSTTPDRLFDTWFTEYLGLLAPLFELADDATVGQLFELVSAWSIRAVSKAWMRTPYPKRLLSYTT
jgi:hypothetical protein